MRNSQSIFDQDASFTHGGKIYVIEKKLSEAVDAKGVIPSQFDNYLITSNEEEFILKMTKNISNRPGITYDSDEDQLIEKEYNVLKKINTHPHTLQCTAKVIIVDKFQNAHYSLIIKKLQYNSLEKYLDVKLHKLNTQALIDLSISVVESFLSFDYENIFYNDELTLSSFGVDENESIVISNGFSFCKINQPENKQEDNQSYIYKKNCAQIKSIVFSILTVNKELLKKYITPYNLYNLVDKIIQNSNLMNQIKNYHDFETIFQDNDLKGLQNFLQYLNNLNKNPIQSSQYNRQQTSQMEKIQKIPTQVYKMAINTEKTELTIPDGKGSQIDINTIPEEYCSDSFDNSQKSYQIVKIKNFKNNENRGRDDSNCITDSKIAAQNDANANKLLSIYGENQNILNIYDTKNNQPVLIEMQYPYQIKSNNDNREKKASNQDKGKEANQQKQPALQDSIFNDYQGRQSIQSQTSNFSNQSESFKRKADKLKDEEIEDISQQTKAKQKQKGEYQDRKQQLQMAKQVELNIKKQQIKKQSSDEENQYQSGSSDPANFPDTQRIKSESLQDKLLTQIQESNSFISDTNVVRILLALLLLFIIGGIIFGVVFNFGVKTPNNSQNIVCQDQNCSYCAEFEDQCTSCKSGYYYDSYSQKCQPNCTTSNCSVCITNYQNCEQCQTGYTLYQNSCLNSQQSCPIQNCSSCLNLKCTQCNSGYRLYNLQCYKICSDPICLQCPNNSNICTQCEPNFYVNPATNTCKSI
ncbi:transmembrane protein, putative (macronuclear) [Tetrahymena thermophila SB210]|uniref:Transmembrane protein, putative n=1 Tax=Tetrahymena thermophila (strain SB210) TaxID=312017 RepID=Q23FE9_TETTS|nr:transmembrane protein, putative [Tetrahymena thermophila SB210]EAR95204.1 transmembrane protein, putative [Tetrahymena thermophila SB210]|eukprot:XP_001015449.1 transmembrane protein, putative [Tetrahymena thermophila SB210]